MDSGSETGESSEDFFAVQVLGFGRTIGPLLAAVSERGLHCVVLTGDLWGALGSVSVGANVLIYLQPRDVARLAGSGHEAHRIILHFVEICLEEEDRRLGS